MVSHLSLPKFKLVKWFAIPVVAVAMTCMSDVKNADAGGFSLQVGGIGYSSGYGYGHPYYGGGFGVGPVLGPGYGSGFGYGYGVSPYQSGYRANRYYSQPRVRSYYAPSRSYYNRGYPSRCR